MFKREFQTPSIYCLCRQGYESSLVRKLSLASKPGIKEKFSEENRDVGFVDADFVDADFVDTN